VTEVADGFAREWLEFADPDDPDLLHRCDLTFLLSGWSCIYGRGCAGIYADRPDDGCCTLGAHFTGRADEQRVRAAAGELTDDLWQYRREGRRGIATVEEGRRRTRTVDGACIFLNRPGFPAGSGCALHLLALRAGRHPLTTKPDVCWQLPVRRSYRAERRADGSRFVVAELAEYTRAGWGPGGAGLHWWCTAAPAAHRAARPLYLRYAAELTEMIGARAYRELARLCRRAPARAPHPAGAPAALPGGRPPVDGEIRRPGTVGGRR
jgi:hypothetical protein